MTKEEYDAGIEGIKNTAREAEAELGREYAYSNNDVKKGDLVKTSHGWTVVEDVVAVIRCALRPYCEYYGVACKPDGTPWTNTVRQCVRQGHVKEHKPNKGVTKDE